MVFVKYKTIGYYKKKYPKGTKVRIREDSEYYEQNTKYNPRDTIGYIYDYKEYSGYFDKYYYFIYVKWNTPFLMEYRITDLEYYKE
jgi:hypothetical protein